MLKEERSCVEIQMVCDMAECDTRETFYGETVLEAVAESMPQGWTRVPFLDMEFDRCPACEGRGNSSINPRHIKASSLPLLKKALT